MSKDYVMGLDVGTTTLRSYIYNKKGDVCGSSSQKVEILYPEPGWEEIDPDVLWERVQQVVKSSLETTGISAEQISSLGISCQRATFVCWSKSTGKHFHNFITWKDMRADTSVREWNNSFSLRGLRLGGKILHSLTRKPRFKAASIYRMYNKMVTLRLDWVLNNVPDLREKATEGDVLFGCVDSWLIYKLTGKHMTEVSNIAATGIYDPFTMDYAGWLFNLVNIPANIMPPVVTSCGDHFGETLPEIFGSSIPLTAVLADQSASVFGSGCFSPGSAKVTLGTGSFLDVITATPHASLNGLIPLVGWKIGEELAYIAEGSVHDLGVLLEWAKSIELFDDFEKMSEIASTASDSGGVYFVPGFHGLTAPVHDPSATAGFIGINLKTSKAQMLKAILESIAFSQKHLVDTFLSESNYKIERLLMDGGVARNDFVLQLIADLTGLPLERADSVEMSVWGVASLAGLQSGLWKDRETMMKETKKTGSKFDKRKNRTKLLEEYKMWERACKRFTKWTDASEF